MPQSLHKTMGLSGHTATIYSSLSLKTIYIPEIHKVNCQCNNEILAQQKITIFKTGSVKTRPIQNINIYKRHKRSLYNIITSTQFQPQHQNIISATQV